MISLNQYTSPASTESFLTQARTVLSAAKGLGGILNDSVLEAEASLGAYLKQPCVLVSSGTSALLHSIEYALLKAKGKPVAFVVSEYLYFSLFAYLESSPFKVHVLEAEANEVTLKPLVLDQNCFNIFLLTSHNNLRPNVAALVQKVPQASRFVIEDRCLTFAPLDTLDCDAACYSFSNNKLINTGEGGCVSSRHTAFLSWLKLRSFSGIAPTTDSKLFMYLGRYTVSDSKFPVKTSVSALTALHVTAQLKTLDSAFSHRRANFRYLAKALAVNSVPVPKSPLFYPLVLPKALPLKEVNKHQLKALRLGLQTHVGVLPYRHFLNQPVLKKVVSLPVHPGLSVDDLKKIESIVRQTFLSEVSK